MLFLPENMQRCAFRFKNRKRINKKGIYYTTNFSRDCSNFIYLYNFQGYQFQSLKALPKRDDLFLHELDFKSKMMKSIRAYIHASEWNRYRLFILFLGLLFSYFFFFHQANVSGLLGVYFLLLAITGNRCLAGSCSSEQQLEKLNLPEN